MEYQNRGIKYVPKYNIYKGKCGNCSVTVEIDYIGNDPGKCPKCKKPLQHCRWCGAHINSKEKPYSCPTCGRKLRRSK